MLFKVFINALFLVVVAVLQLAFFNNNISFLSGVDLIMLTIIFLIGIYKIEVWFLWILGFGFIYEIYSFLPFGFHLAIIILTTISVSFFVTNFLTNRSLYAFVASVFLYLFFYYSYFSVFLFILKIFLEIDAEFLQTSLINYIVDRSVVNIILLLFIYTILNTTSNILRPVFLRK